MLNKNFNAYKSNVIIKLTEPLDIPTHLTYAEKHQLLSASARQINISYNGRSVYSCTVPKDIFNPYGSIVPKRMVELILDETVSVQARQVIDLGCGCGLLGLASILKGCQQVLFTDINPHVTALQEHPLLRTVDTVKVQDILVNESDESWDLIIACPPSQPTEQQITADNYESGIFLGGDLISRIIADSSRVLKPGGELFLYVRLPQRNFLDCYTFIQQLNQHFDLNTMNILDFTTGKDFPYGDPETSALCFSIKKDLNN